MRNHPRLGTDFERGFGPIASQHQSPDPFSAEFAQYAWNTRQEYRAFFVLIDWEVAPERAEDRPWPGRAPHPEKAYVKALLVKQCAKLETITELRRFLVKHPLLVMELGFHLVTDHTQPYGLDVVRSVPCDCWLRHKQQTLPNEILQALFRKTVDALQVEIPGLGETVVIDTKHIYAWVKENNPREFIKARYDPAQQPSGDPDCRLGVKRSSNQDDGDGHVEVRKEYLWGYGSGVVAAIDPDLPKSHLNCRLKNWAGHVLYLHFKGGVNDYVAKRAYVPAAFAAHAAALIAASG